MSPDELVFFAVMALCVAILALPFYEHFTWRRRQRRRNTDLEMLGRKRLGRTHRR